MHMPSTLILVQAEGFTLKCPGCDAIIEEINMNRVWENTVQCYDCLETSTLVITLER